MAGRTGELRSGPRAAIEGGTAARRGRESPRKLFYPLVTVGGSAGSTRAWRGVGGSPDHGLLRSIGVVSPALMSAQPLMPGGVMWIWLCDFLDGLVGPEKTEDKSPAPLPTAKDASTTPRPGPVDSGANPVLDARIGPPDRPKQKS